MKNIIIIDSSSNINKTLFDFLSDLSEKDYCCRFISNAHIESLKKNYLTQSKFILIPELNRISAYFIYPISFLFSLYYFFLFFKMKRSMKIEAVLLCNLREKLILTPLLRILKLNPVWIELPEAEYSRLPKFLLKSFSRKANKVKILVFSNLSRLQLLNLKINAENIFYLPLSVKLNQVSEQTNIFSTIAKSDRAEVSRKYFTIGSILDLSNPGQLEDFFSAAKVCLEVIRDLQIIVVDTGKLNEEENKRFRWLAKKIGIENITWIVKENVNLKKWLDSFDLFVSLGEKPELDNLNMILKAMSAGKALICLDAQSAEDLITDNKNGLISRSGDIEALAQKIMQLYNNPRLRRVMGNNARETASNFDQAKMIMEFEKIITHNV